MVFKNKKECAAWLLIVIVEAAFVCWWFGAFVLPGTALTMTQSEYALLVSAAKIVKDDMPHYETAADAKNALIQNLPSAIRDKVDAAIGSPAVDQFPAKLDEVLSKVRTDE